MAFTGTSLTAAYLAFTAADKPLFMANNVLRDYNARPQWRTGGSWASGSDITDPSYPTWLGYDGKGASRTAPTLTGGSAAYSYLCDLVEGTDADHSFDMAVVWNHNFHLLDGTVTVRLEIADDNAFTTNLTTLTTWTVVTDPSRLVSLNLNNNRRYTNARYVRLRITTSAGSFTTAPAFGELWLGRRRQMSIYPNLPYEMKRLRSTVADFTAKSGARIRYVHNAGQRVFELAMSTGGAVESTETENEIRGFWQDCRYGSLPFVHIPQPESYPEEAFVCLDEDADLGLPLVGPYEREGSFSFTEIAPYRQGEVE